MIARACWVEKHIRCTGQFEVRTKLRSEMRPCTCPCHSATPHQDGEGIV